MVPSLKSRTALTTVYAAGLRVSEVVLLKLAADIDSQRMVIRVEQGKGGKDRYALQVEVLRRLGQGGHHYVRVEYAHVTDRGQAVISNVKKADCPGCAGPRNGGGATGPFITPIMAATGVRVCGFSGDVRQSADCG